MLLPAIREIRCSELTEIQAIEANPIQPVHVLCNAVELVRPDNITGCEIGNLRNPIYTGFIVPAVMADQKLCNPIALLTELNTLDTDILLPNQFHTLVAMGIILVFRVTANVVKQAEIDQDLLVLFRKAHS